MKTDSNGNEVYQGYTLIKPAKRGEDYRITTPDGKTYPNGGVTRDEARAFVKELVAGEKIKAESDVTHEKRMKIATEAGKAAAIGEQAKRTRPPAPVASAPKTITIRLHGGIAKAEKRTPYDADTKAKVTDDKMLVRIVEAPRSPSYVGQYGIIDKSDVLTPQQVAEFEEQQRDRRLQRKEKKRPRTSTPIRHGRKVA